tara:strand:- start:3217 stop:3462 length:246 start_codon:yes stop_codon:yes gene_type:complete
MAKIENVLNNLAKKSKEQLIINDILRQGRIFLDSNKLKYSDLTTDKVFFISENELTNDNNFADIYYDNENEILNTLIKWRK